MENDTKKAEKASIPPGQAFQAALVQDDQANQTFSWLAPSHRLDFLSWIQAAEKECDRFMRVQDALDILAGREVIRRH